LGLPRFACENSAACPLPDLPANLPPYQQEEDHSLPLPALLRTPWGQVAAGAELTGLAAMAPFIYAEICTALAYGAGFFDPWRLLDVATYCLQVSTAWMG